MLIALFIIQGLVDLYLLGAVVQQYRRQLALKESLLLLIQAAELSHKIMLNHENQLNELESVQ